MKVLLCHNRYQQPGGEDQVFADEKGLLERGGHEVVSYTAHNDEIEQMKPWSVAARALWNRKTYAELRDLVRRERPEVMHCTNTFPLISPAAYYAARAENVAVVQSLHNYRMHCTNGYFLRNGQVCERCLGKFLAWPGILHACYRQSRAATSVTASVQALHRLLGTWSRKVDLYVTCSQFSASKFLEGGIPPDKIVVKPNFVYPDPGPGEGQGGYAVFVGRLSPEKGIHTLLDAWSRLGKRIPLKFVGDGPLAEHVQHAAEANPNLEWLGWRSPEEVYKIVGDASFLVMPSVWYETFGRTIIEAFAKATPVIVSRMGAMAELVDDHRTGLTFEPGDAPDLVRKVEELLSDEAARQSMREAARREYQAKYTAEVNNRMLVDIYERALHGAASRSRRRRGVDPRAAWHTTD